MGARDAGDREEEALRDAPSAAPRVFISYRRDDSEGHAGRLYDALAGRFGERSVFMDIDTIPLGVDFTRVINDAVGSCDVLVAVIGPQWVTLVGTSGRRRLDDPNDFVRLEVKAALERDVRVIPALVQNARMPSAHDLPEDLAGLAVRNAISLRADSWRHGVERLLAAVADVGQEKAEREQQEREETERKRAEREKAEREEAEREAAHAKAERERAQREKVEWERAERERVEEQKRDRAKERDVTASVLLRPETEHAQVARERNQRERDAKTTLRLRALREWIAFNARLLRTRFFSRSRRRIAVITGSVVIVAGVAAAALLWLTVRADGIGDANETSGVYWIRSDDIELQETFFADADVYDFDLVDGGVWALVAKFGSTSDFTITHVDWIDETVESFGTVAGSGDIQVGDSAVWVTPTESAEVVRIDYETGARKRWKLGSASVGDGETFTSTIAPADDAVWITGQVVSHGGSESTGTLWRIDPNTNRLQKIEESDGALIVRRSEDGGVWLVHRVADRDTMTIRQIGGPGQADAAALTVPAGFLAIGAERSAWIANSDGVAFHVDIETGDVVATVRFAASLGDEPKVAVDDIQDRVWLTARHERRLYRIDSYNNRFLDAIPVAARYTSDAAGPIEVVAVGNTQELWIGISH